MLAYKHVSVHHNDCAFRILVLPRKQFFYLLTRNKQWADNKMTFDSIYHMDKLVDVLDMMPMKDFLETEGHAQGYLKEPYPQIANFESVPSQELFTWIQERTHMEQPSTDKRVMGFTFNFSFAQHPNPCAAPQAEQLFSTGVRLDDRLKTFLMHRTLSEYDMVGVSHCARVFCVETRVVCCVASPQPASDPLSVDIQRRLSTTYAFLYLVVLQRYQG
jgi:hypothetical protein